MSCQYDGNKYLCNICKVHIYHKHFFMGKMKPYNVHGCGQPYDIYIFTLARVLRLHTYF